ncbi:Serine/threonine kinase [Entomophthora muscae]|uniref:Serine/threonine kinase n=1 Tax=Entomophthora muscae TaxID=34485 RepID=A0ACC2TEE8_9FUNG|nr:Serine/threonine kinase [Entomophthora muscae]
MAPELVLGRGYGHGVDWWALGITLYELLFKRIPFKGNLKKHRMSIVNQPIQWPNCATPSPLLNLLKILLVKDPALRYPNHSSLKEFKAHPSFSQIDFEKLGSKQLIPPFCPDVTKLNVESGLDLEELLLDELPLESIPTRRNFNTIKRMPEKLLFLEYSFRDYNPKIDPPVEPKFQKNFCISPPPAGFLRRVTRSFSGGFPHSQTDGLENCYASRPSFITRLRLKKSTMSIRPNQI